MPSFPENFSPRTRRAARCRTAHNIAFPRAESREKAEKIRKNTKNSDAAFCSPVRQAIRMTVILIFFVSGVLRSVVPARAAVECDCFRSQCTRQGGIFQHGTRRERREIRAFRRRNAEKKRLKVEKSALREYTI